MKQLDFSRIQAASPYTIEEIANGIYLFETEHDVLYKIELEEDSPIGGCDTYQFYINNVRHVRAERDTKVKRTVMAILVEFCRVSASVLSLAVTLFLVNRSHKKRSRDPIPRTLAIPVED